MNALNALKGLMDQMIAQTCAPALFPIAPVLDFSPDKKVCPGCGNQLNVLKTRTKSVATMHIGAFIARETLLFCTGCADNTVYACQDLERLVPRRCRFGYDVMVHVGKTLFLKHRGNSEIIEGLAAKNIPISTSEIDYLGKKFIVTLALAHRRQAEKIKHAMQTKGGYILHLDSTCDGNSPMLMTGLDSVSNIVLGSVKLPSEKAEKIIPFIRELIGLFGDPLAVVHDMGSGIMKAVATVLPDTANFVCHFHFLRDIGKDLFEEPYGIIRNRLKKYGIRAKLRRRARAFKAIIDDNPCLIDRFCSRVDNPSYKPEGAIRSLPVAEAYSLIQWALDGKNQGHGYGFPFDQPLFVFAQRLHIAYDYCNRLKNRGDAKISARAFGKLANDLKPFIKDPMVGRALVQIKGKIKIFDKLRAAMRIAPRSTGYGLNDDGMDVKIQTIEKRVKKFHAWLSHHDELSKSFDYHKTIKQLEKYWEKLFADPIEVDTVQGKSIIQPQRTNNILERFFRSLKRDIRKKTGNNSMKRALRAMLSDTPLVKNLQNRKYVEVLLDGKDSLAELFATINYETVQKEMQNAAKNPEKVPPKIKRIIAKPLFPEIILNV